MNKIIINFKNIDIYFVLLIIKYIGNLKYNIIDFIIL